MKIISGKLKGRVIDTYDIEGTRPTMDRVRESLFAMIQNDIQDSVVLDLFAGSGTLGLEAYSNGAKEVFFNDKNALCTKKIQEYCKKFDIVSSCHMMTSSYLKCLETLKEQKQTFDIIFLDPPYAMECFQEILDYLFQNQMVKPNGKIILEYDHEYAWKSPYSQIKKKKYGNKWITIEQNISLK